MIIAFVLLGVGGAVVLAAAAWVLAAAVSEFRR